MAELYVIRSRTAKNLYARAPCLGSTPKMKDAYCYTREELKFFNYAGWKDFVLIPVSDLTFSK